MSMQQDRSPLQSLNLSIKYVSHWKYLFALRQLYQNFMDACIQAHPEHQILNRSNPQPSITKFTQARRSSSSAQQLDLIEPNYISYNKETKQLIFENDKSFPIRCMLMGCSEKGPNALGQFGEGMKISMMLLLKEGMDMTIQSGEFIYYPTIKSWDHNGVFVGQYDHEVLYVKIQKRAKIQKTRVIIDNCDQAKFQEFLYLSLALLDQTKFQRICFPQKTLIIPKDPRLIGKIYKKGVRLELHQSQNSQKYIHYAYDFEKIQVGRDRDCVNNVWDLYKLQSQLHYKVGCLNFDKTFKANNPHLKPILQQHVQKISNFISIGRMETYYLHNYTAGCIPFCDLLYQKFLIRCSPNQYPEYDAASVENARNLLLYGLDKSFYLSIPVGWQQFHNLKYSTKYITSTKKIQQQIINKQIRQPTELQMQALTQIKQKISHVIPEIVEYAIKIKNFKEVYCAKQKPEKGKIIYVNPDKIGDGRLVKEVCKIALI